MDSSLRKLRLHLVVSGAFLLLCLVLVLAAGEQAVFRAIRGFTLQHPEFESFLRFYTEWSKNAFYALFAVMGIWGLVMKNRRIAFYVLAYLAVQLIAAVLLTRVLKLTVGRLRPSSAVLDPSYSESSRDSFPSGHTSDMASSTSVLAYFIGSIALRMVLYAMLALMAISRIGLGKHYPLDVICGAFLGLFTGYIVSHLFATRFLPRVQTREKSTE